MSERGNDLFRDVVRVLHDFVSDDVFEFELLTKWSTVQDLDIRPEHFGDLRFRLVEQFFLTGGFELEYDPSMSVGDLCEKIADALPDADAP